MNDMLPNQQYDFTPAVEDHGGVIDPAVRIKGGKNHIFPAPHERYAIGIGRVRAVVSL